MLQVCDDRYQRWLGMQRLVQHPGRQSRGELCRDDDHVGTVESCTKALFNSALFWDQHASARKPPPKGGDLVGDHNQVHVQPSRFRIRMETMSP